MEILRTPDDRFDGLPDWPYEARYVDVGGLRMHYVDHGPPQADPVLLLHGEPTWSYLYRHMIPLLAEAGHRVIAPDLIGFGRSDKPAAAGDHTYARHVGWVATAIDALGLERITLVCQDWGGLIGLRVLAEHPERFARTVAANTGLPTGDQQMPADWVRFRDFVARADELPIAFLLQGGTTTELPDAALAGYAAPFPDAGYQAGPLVLPLLIPTTPDDPASEANRRAWQRLATLELPFLCAFSDADPITRGADRPMRERFRGAQDQPHTTIEGAGHFLQEDAGPALAAVVNDFIEAT